MGQLQSSCSPTRPFVIWFPLTSSLLTGFTPAILASLLFLKEAKLIPNIWLSHLHLAIACWNTLSTYQRSLLPLFLQTSTQWRSEKGLPSPLHDGEPPLPATPIPALPISHNQFFSTAFITTWHINIILYLLTSSLWPPLEWKCHEDRDSTCFVHYCICND